MTNKEWEQNKQLAAIGKANYHNGIADGLLKAANSIRTTPLKNMDALAETLCELAEKARSEAHK